MYLKQLDLSGIRNLAATRLSLAATLNVFYGDNGSGKTSLLEAIYLLGLGRSFRANIQNQVINFNKNTYAVSALISNKSAEEYGDLRIGTEKFLEQKASFSKNGSKAQLVEIARFLPLMLIDSSSFSLIDGGPAGRREFIDLAMFHVEHDFVNISHKYKRALLQRNAVLKTKLLSSVKAQQVIGWDEILIAMNEAITLAREQFLAEFTPFVNKLLENWCYYGKISLKYKSGWSDNCSFTEALAANWQLDCNCGFTNKGSHRAEIEILIADYPAKTVLSRGQQKVFACAMVIAKAMFLKQKAELQSVFLIDDLAAELDPRAFTMVFSKILQLNSQIFITGINKANLLATINEIDPDLLADAKLFHVEQSGLIVAENIDCYAVQ